MAIIHETHPCQIRRGASAAISGAWCIDEFAPVLRALGNPDELHEEDVVRPDLLLHVDEYRGRRLEVYYVPFDWVNTAARVVLVGITPGRQQMHLAVREASRVLQAGGSVTEALCAADAGGSFAGAMRANLIRMLDVIGLARALSLVSCEQLFSDQAHLVTTTSAISHAVFVDGRNYTGHHPPFADVPLLRAFVTHVLAAHLAMVPGALVIPLGVAAEEAVRLCLHGRGIDESRCLFGLPHPSGANGHRRRQFELRQDALRAGVARWARSDSAAAPAI